MLETDAPVDSHGRLTKNEEAVAVRGFDLTPLNRDLSASLSEFDRVRLQMFYEPIHRYYGYPTFSFEEHPLPENLVRELFKYPFRFEGANLKIFKNPPAQEAFHEWIQQILQNCWRQEFIAPRLIPLEAPIEQEQETGKNIQKARMAARKGNRKSALQAPCAPADDGCGKCSAGTG